ncbi:MAG: urea carboxylase [Porticoccaceae bacterium]
MKRVLIANRGAIAVRIMRTLREMGIESVAVYAEADRDSLHVRKADHVYSLGEGTARETYLNQDKIFSVAKEAQVDAIHPGYGFLSENTGFVRRCEELGIGFIGPTPEQIESFGLKHKARDLARSENVPLLPGSGVLADLNQALAQAQFIGFPVMLKSSAGGGGIGMQLCRSVQELKKAYDSVLQLSQNNFSSGELFLEKFVERARHIEVQIFGDGKGKVISLGERDCSAQRRNQKVIEETPAPELNDATRQALAEVACRLAAAVNYRNAGTVEFILDADTREFYFLEVNTRLQVEHGVTEEVYGVDIVRWMVQLCAGTMPDLDSLHLQPRGHAIQARLYAEDPARDFQPCAGLLSLVEFPETAPGLRIDHWVESGIEVSPFYDPMLAKIIVKADTRELAIQQLNQALARSRIYGIETNLEYLQTLLQSQPITSGIYSTSTLAGLKYQKPAFEVLSAGTMTTVQDYSGRTGYWNVGIPPSGPFDSLSFRLGNQLLDNPEDAAGLEMTMQGATLRFLSPTRIVLAGANMPASLDDKPIAPWKTIEVKAGQVLEIGMAEGAGVRSYLLVQGGIQCPDYLGSKATFTLGKFGGHAGRALRSGDVLHLQALPENASFITRQIAPGQVPEIGNSWELHVLPGPQGSPDFFSENYINEFFSVDWEVHFNSSRTGVRLIGPKPEWARTDGGEAGMHPSNIHDNAYALGTVDFTGDMPVILGPDGPSLGGFVCPATVATADLWKLGQLKAGDRVRFVPVTRQSALNQISELNQAITELNQPEQLWHPAASNAPHIEYFDVDGVGVGVRRAGDSWLLVEFGDMVLDIELRFYVHRLMRLLANENIAGVLELTPGIRSLQIHFDCLRVEEAQLLALVRDLCQSLITDDGEAIPARIVYLPLSWDDEQCRLAIEKYQQVVRKDAPWYPSNIEFIRRINGLDSMEEVKRIVFDASYLVMGLGDVYLGAPVATPLDPRHRLVTTKYNPARTWTAENSVGIGGSYMCIYGMEGPGGYQFVGRTLQMWNVYRQTREFEQPWLLRFFDQIRFYPVSGEELLEIRRKFPLGQYPLKIEHTEFRLAEYKQFLADNEPGIQSFTESRQQAFDQELANWKRTGQLQFEPAQADVSASVDAIPDGVFAIESPVAGSIWKLLVEEGDSVKKGQPVLVLESMKMEVEVQASRAGQVNKILQPAGATVQSGSRLLFIEKEK